MISIGEGLFPIPLISLRMDCTEREELLSKYLLFNLLRLFNEIPIPALEQDVNKLAMNVISRHAKLEKKIDQIDKQYSQ